MQTGAALIREMDATRVAPGQVAFWWLGQLSFVLKVADATLYLDPFLSPHPRRRVPALLAPDQITHATVIAGTHDHTDHIDRAVWPALARASPAARFVVPDLLRERLAHELDVPLSRFVGINDGMTVEVQGIRITGVAAAHEFLDPDPVSGRFPYMGYVFEAGNCVCYHSGDACVYEGLLTKLRRWRLDIMFLPINGRDAVRYRAGIIGNMTYQEAADLAGPLRPGLVVPGHYDMFPGNQADPQAFADYVRVKYPGQAVHICDYAERTLYEQGRGVVTPAAREG